MGGADFESIFKASEERLEGKYPGAQERIDNLTAEGVGKPIQLTLYRQNPSPNSQPRYLKTKTENIGYILPVDHQNIEHVILFSTGEVMVIVPRKITDEYDLNRYREQTTPSEEPLDMSGYEPTTLPAQVDRLINLLVLTLRSPCGIAASNKKIRLLLNSVRH